MSIAKYNKGSKFNFKGTEENVFIGLAELAKTNGMDTIYKIVGFYINTKSKYGDSPVAVIPGFNVNIPSHKLEEVKAIMDDAETVEQINAGKAGFKVETYKQFDKQGKEVVRYSVEWVDIE